MFATLRANEEACLSQLLQKSKFIALAIEGFYSSKNKVDELGASKRYNLGQIMRCCNAIRLQVETLAPTAFLKNF